MKDTWWTSKQMPLNITMADAAEYLYLPDDCWEHVFIFLNDGDNDYDHNSYLESISAVSKQFFSITNRLRSSLTIRDPTAPFLSSLFHRFTNLTSIDLTHFHGDLDALLCQIPPLKNLTSLNLSDKPTIPSIGLRAFSKKITTLTSLICCNLLSFTSTHLFLIADCFPLLQELNLDCAGIINEEDSTFIDGIEALSLSLFKLRKLNLSYHYYVNDKSIFHLFKNCRLLEEVIMSQCRQLTAAGVVSAIREQKQTMLKTLCLPSFIIPQIFEHSIDSLASFKGLTSIDLSYMNNSGQLLSYIVIAGLPLRRIDLCCCTGYSYDVIFSLLSKCQSIQHLDFQYSAVLNDHRVVELSSFLVGLVSVNLSDCMVTYSTLFALVRKCPSLSEIKMQNIGRNSVENHDYLMDFGVHPQLKSLDLSYNPWLSDESITMLASVFPDLHLLDFQDCENITEHGILQVLRRCRKISHLNVSFCSRRSLPRIINFEVPNLKMLNLSFTPVNDETLCAISKSCGGLLELLLRDCDECTYMGVKYVLENCTRLKEIDLKRCRNVHTDVASMLFLRPSLRKITAPPDFHFSESERKLFLLQGCIVN